MGQKSLVNQSFANKNDLTTLGIPDIEPAQLCALGFSYRRGLELSYTVIN